MKQCVYTICTCIHWSAKAKTFFFQEGKKLHTIIVKYYWLFNVDLIESKKEYHCQSYSMIMKNIHFIVHDNNIIQQFWVAPTVKSEFISFEICSKFCRFPLLEEERYKIQWLPWCCLLECVQTLNFITKHKCVTYKQWRSNCNIFSNTGSQIHYLNTVASNIYYSNLISCHSSPFFGSSDPPPL